MAVPAGERGESLARRGGGVPLAVAVPVLETEGLPPPPAPLSFYPGSGTRDSVKPTGMLLCDSRQRLGKFLTWCAKAAAGKCSFLSFA